MIREKEFLLKIADIGFHARWSIPCTRFIKDPCYKGFLFLKDIEKEGRGLRHCTSIDFSHSSDDLPSPEGMKELFRMPDHWTLYETGSGYYLERFHPFSKRLLSVSRISKDLSRVTYHPEKAQSWDITYLLQPLIKYLLVNILALNGGIMLHGAVIKTGGKAFIFSGRSGSGKTTLSELFRASGIQVMTDENIVIRKRDGRICAYGTPWPGGGRMAASDSAPVGAICFISHGTENVLRKADAKRSAKNILYQAIVQTWDPASIGRIFDSVNAVAANTPCFDMPFVNDESVVKFVMKNLAP